MRGIKAQPLSSQGVEGEETPARSMRILVAGSLSDSLSHMEGTLRRAGYEPVWESGGFESVESLPLGPYDLVIADGDSGSFDCDAVVRMRRVAGCDLPFLVLSDDPGEEKAVAVIKAGADEWVEKGRLAEQLVAAVARGVIAAEARRAARLEAEEKEAVAEVSGALARVALELVAAWGSRMLLERLGQIGVQVLQCDFSSTLMLEPGGDAFELVATHGWTAEGQEVSRLVRAPLDMMGPVFERFARGKAFEVKTKPMASVLPTHGQLRHLFAPLRLDGEVIGIQIFSRHAGARPFTSTESRIAMGMAELASLSLTPAQVIDELERVHHVKSDFVATVSHELRTPLHIVMGYTDLLVDGAFGSLADEQQQALQRIRQRARGLLELINATLDLNRLEAGHISVDVEPTDLSELMELLQRETAEAHNNPHLRLVWDIPEDLPIVSTDPGKLKVALKNLISNALKFTDRGTVTVRVEANADEMEFSIADTGVGIAPEALPIVFEAFRQADSSSTRRFGGVGLGLYIVRRLLDLLGGRVEVESTPGQGSTFRIHLPRGAPAR